MPLKVNLQYLVAEVSATDVRSDSNLINDL